MECLQSTLEFVYSNGFTKVCPDFSDIIVRNTFIGCRWSRLDMSAIEAAIPKFNAPFGRLDFPGVPVKSSCAISMYMYSYFTVERGFDYPPVFALLGSLVLLFCIGLLQIEEVPVQGFVRPVPEPMFILLVYFLANVGFLLLLASKDYIVLCDSLSSYNAAGVADAVSYAIIVFYTLRRCIRLKAAQVSKYGDLSSWSSFVRADRDELDAHERRWRRFFRFCYLSAPIAIIGTWKLDYFLPRNSSAHYHSNRSMCLYGSVRDVRATGFEYSKVAVEIIAVFVYVFGPSPIK